MAVNVKLGVDLSSFTSGIREGQNVMKGLNAEMKATDAAFKATGNAEQMLANKTKVLNSQIQIQKGIADQAQQALQALTNAGAAEVRTVNAPLPSRGVAMSMYLRECCAIVYHAVFG